MKYIEHHIKATKEIAARLKEIRIVSGDTQEECANKLGISRVYYNRLESLPDRVTYTDKFLNRVCTMYNVNADWLIHGRGEPYTKPKPSPEEIGSYSIFEIDESMINNTKAFVALQTEKLFEKGTLDSKEYFAYFKTVNSILETTFNLLNELKESKKNHDENTAKRLNAYINKFSEITFNSNFPQKN